MTNLSWFHARLTFRSPMPRKPPTPITTESISPDEPEISYLSPILFSHLQNLFKSRSVLLVNGMRLIASRLSLQSRRVKMLEATDQLMIAARRGALAPVYRWLDLLGHQERVELRADLGGDLSALLFQNGSGCAVGR
jgi:hypothetical protein